MKQLRILTGRHAGARLRLTRQQSTLGNTAEADVQITDWKHPPVALTIDEASNMIRMTTGSAGAGGAARATTLDDFVPRRFGDIVMCVGPDDGAAWPSDVELLSRMLGPKRRAQGKRRIGPMAIAGSIACTALLAAFVSLVLQSVNKAEAKVPRVPLQVRVAAELARMGLNEVGARDAGPKVIVEGLVDGSADLARMHSALQQFGQGSIIHKVVSASDIAQSISDALANPALHVKYGGRGVFRVEGSVVDVERLRGAAQRIAGDLGSVVKRIDVAVTELPPPQLVQVDAMLVDDELRYVQTRDGTKHLIVVSPPETRDSARESLIH
ncbi:MAG TPA: hypothetical protein VF169_01175 [Albitalea sp.]|uniref:hypothetical protein n=1 Tax=Piscinibacter sp. TaxID=1903157 RepID=UPI002ED55870